MKHLEQVHELYRIISDHALDIITIASPEGVTRHISPAVRNLLGYEMDEIIGNKMIDLWHPDDRLAIDERCFLSNSDVNMFICRVRHKEGYYVWFETTVKIIRNEDGDVEKWSPSAGILRNVNKPKMNCARPRNDLNPSSKITGTRFGSLTVTRKSLKPMPLSVSFSMENRRNHSTSAAHHATKSRPSNKGITREGPLRAIGDRFRND